MTIENALEGADKVRKKLLIDNAKPKDVREAADIIEKLIRIIYWYDANQQRLIKTVSKLSKRENAMKRILATYFADEAEVASYDPARIIKKDN